MNFIRYSFEDVKRLKCQGLASIRRLKGERCMSHNMVFELPLKTFSRSAHWHFCFCEKVYLNGVSVDILVFLSLDVLFINRFYIFMIKKLTKKAYLSNCMSK